MYSSLLISLPSDVPVIRVLQPREEQKREKLETADEADVGFSIRIARMTLIG